jgi:hypothetical protein
MSAIGHNDHRAVDRESPLMLNDLDLLAMKRMVAIVDFACP